MLIAFWLSLPRVAVSKILETWVSNHKMIRMEKLNYFWNKHHVFQRFQSTRNTQLIASFNRQNVKRAITTSTPSAFCRLNGQHSSGTPRKLIQIPFSQPLPFNFWHSFWQKIHKLLPQRGLNRRRNPHSIPSFFSLFFVHTRPSITDTTGLD